MGERDEPSVLAKESMWYNDGSGWPPCDVDVCLSVASLYCSVTLLQACGQSTAGCPGFDALH
jgi:hypothetical protein